MILDSRKGQIYIDYLGGSLLFFLSLIFIVTSSLGTIPQFSEEIERNSVELSAWSLSTQLIENTGFWKDGDSQGSDWHEKTGEPQVIKTVGLASEGGGMDRDKVREVVDMSYNQLKLLLSTSKDFNMEFKEFAFVDTHKSFSKPGSPGVGSFKPPASKSYTNTVEPVHYGSIALNGEEKHFLVVSHNQSYDTAFVSSSWDFTNSTELGLEDETILGFGEKSYRFEGLNSAILTSEGNVLALSRIVGRAGIQPPADAGQVIGVTRFSNMGEKLVKAKMQFWK
ncbi:MAG: hypothetical protein SVV03_05770 [Candidatus Nanohaloarchaea archaeon]|nr:hypothetical protein [Candidatus Nanohaloarchaea archaeon]